MKDMRVITEQALGMPAGGLDGKKAVVKVLLSAIINDEPVTFDESGALPPTAPVHPPEPMTFGRAKTAVAGLILRKLPKPQFAPYKAPNIDLGDLTIRDYHSQNPVKAVVDLILNHREQISEDHVKNCVVNMKLEDLPAIARPPPTAIAINHFTQTAFLPAGSDNWHIVKFITFLSDGPDGKVTPELARSYQHGTMHLINYSSNNKEGKKVFIYLFEQLGGFQVRQWDLQGSSAAPAEDTSEELDCIDQGFDFIDKSWRERSVPASGLRQVQWITRCTKDRTCPLYEQGAFKWNARIINQAITAMRNEGCLAKVVVDCPYTVQTFSPWFVDEVLVNLVPHLKVRSLGLVGRSASGKTPLMEGVATIFSRYWKRELDIDGPGWYRTATDLDFFRGETGTVDRPDGLDDADPKLIPPSKWKAFGDVGLTESMTRERWGASKWVRNQLRLFAFNPFCDDSEPAQGNTVSHDQFMKILDPIFGKEVDEESKLAVLKRSCFVVLTNEWVYWRVATRDLVEVPRVNWFVKAGDNKSIVDDSAIPVIASWQEKQLQLPANYDEQLRWEEKWMEAVMSKGVKAIPRLIPLPEEPPSGFDVIPSTPAGVTATPPVRIQAGIDGQYHVPIPVIGTGGVLRSKFNFGKTGSMTSACSRPSASTTNASSSAAASSSSTAGGNSVIGKPAPGEGYDAKRVKTERGARVAKTHEIEELKEQLQRAQSDLETLPLDIKQEALDHDDAFSDMVAAFASETEQCPMTIEDSD